MGVFKEFGARLLSYILPPLLNWAWDKCVGIINRWEERTKAKEETKPKE